MQPMPAPYLCCYDYGQGGVWLLADAASPEEVTSKYPGLKVFTERPNWMTNEEETKLRLELEDKGFHWNVHLPPTGWLVSRARERGAVSLPPQIMQTLGAVIPELASSSFIPVVFEESKSFGNFFVTFASNRRAITIALDRGQLLVSGPPDQELQASGLWRAFSGPSNYISRSKSGLPRRVGPNPSLKRSANGRPPGPVWRYAVHFRQSGPGVLPLSPA